MPITKLFGLTGLAKPLTSEEGRRVLERDLYRCQYCGLDGASSFENSLIMTVDFVHPRAQRGMKDPENLVAACRPCNLIKGRRVFRDLEHAMCSSAGTSSVRSGRPERPAKEADPHQPGCEVRMGQPNTA
jgi:hypothetical protein